MRIDTPEITPSDLNIETQRNMETGFGRFLRRTSLDETLQLFNIFIRQMAYIAPRPLIDKEGNHVTIEMRKQNGAIKL